MIHSSPEMNQLNIQSWPDGLVDYGLYTEKDAREQQLNNKSQTNQYNNGKVLKVTLSNQDIQMANRHWK